VSTKDVTIDEIHNESPDGVKSAGVTDALLVMKNVPNGQAGAHEGFHVDWRDPQDGTQEDTA
jgi:hypothetical protein